MSTDLAIQELWAIVDGKNVKIANISKDDSDKIGRGFDIGYSFGIVTDVDTGKQYEIKQASCGEPSCMCAVSAEELPNA